MKNRFDDQPAGDAAEGLVPLLLVVLVLVCVVVLFLLFKFNLFNGGTSVNMRQT